MNILVLGGTRFFGRHLVLSLLNAGHQVTIATRGITRDDFSNRVSRIIVERTDPVSLQQAISGKYYDVIYDNLAYCSNDVKIILNAANCGRYIMTSSAAVYSGKGEIREADFDPLGHKLIWGDRGDFPYDEGKRQAECALLQCFPDVNAAAVRFPYVIGEYDYTNRLFFYVEHSMKQIPMFIDEQDSPLSFVRSDEAGAFLAFLAEDDFQKAVNGSSPQTVSARELLTYIGRVSGRSAVLMMDGDKAPYNGGGGISLDTETAKALGFEFSPLTDWIYILLNKYVEKQGAVGECGTKI